MPVPQEILDLVEMEPVEDLVLALLRDRITSVPIQSLIRYGQSFPFILIHRGGYSGDWKGDPRFLDWGQIDVHVFCEGVDADSDATLISEAVRVVMRDAVNKVVPDKGHLTKVNMFSSATRAPDWDTATGPVQYADLPDGVVRYHSTFDVEIRKPEKLAG